MEKQEGLAPLLSALSAAAKELDELLGEEFVGMALFGSWARGEARPDSDVDVFIVLRSLKGMEARSRIYKVIARRVRRGLTLIDMRLEELKGTVELTPLFINIVADAIVIWDKEGLLHSFIEKGRELIKKAGLVRYKTPDGKYGWKRRDGQPLEPVEL